MTNSRKAAKSAVIIIIFSLGSKLLGFLREILIAAKFGSGIETDTYFTAIAAIGVVSGLVGSSISTTFIPILSEVESKEGKKGKINHTNNMLNIIIFFSFILVIIAWLGAPIIIKFIAKGFEGEQFKLAVLLTRIGLPTVIIGGIIAVFTGYLHSEQKFKATSAIGFPFNLTFILFLLFLSGKFGIKGLMVASVIATLCQLLLQLPEAFMTGYRYNFSFDLKNIYLINFVKLTIPIYIGIFVAELNIIIDKTLASTLDIGSISALTYGNRLNGLILGVFISAITTVIFPLLSKESSNENIDGVKKIMNYGVNLILLVTVPATVGLIILSKPIVEIAFMRGAFDTTAVKMTSQALVFYSVGLVATAIRLLIIRVYYSLKDTKTPMIVGTLSVVLNIVLNLILIKFMEHSGLALATSIATTFAMILMVYILRKKIGSLGTKEYIATFLKTGLASLIMGIVTYFTYHGLYRLLGVSKLYNLISLLVAIGVGAILYGILCYVFNVEEVRGIIEQIKVKFIK